MKTESIQWLAMTDQGILNHLGLFIQQTRLGQNKTQQEVAHSAGVNRSTVSQIEKGNGSTLLSFVQILRVLNELTVLETFEVDQRVSPLLIAKQEQKKRTRARNKGGSNHTNKISW